MRAAPLFLGLALAAAGAAGCNEFHYYDVNVSFNGNSGAADGFKAGSEISKIQVGHCHGQRRGQRFVPHGPQPQGLPAWSGATPRHLRVLDVRGFGSR